jgi:hypothetical protein
MASVEFPYNRLYEVDPEDLWNDSEYELTLQISGPTVTSASTALPSTGAITEFPAPGTPTSFVEVNSTTVDSSINSVVIKFTPSQMNANTKAAEVNLTVTLQFASTSSVTFPMAASVVQMRQAIDFTVVAVDPTEPHCTSTVTVETPPFTYPFNTQVTVEPVTPTGNQKRDGTSLILPVTVNPPLGSTPSVVCAFLSVIVNFGAR